MSKITIANFSGGQSTSKYSGAYGSYAYGKGLDIHSEPGVLQAGQALSKDSGATVTSLILWSVVDADGTYYGGSDNGKIWKRTTGGTWSSEKDLSSRICGFAYYNGYYYAATSNTLYRATTVAGLTSWQTWTGDYVDTEWHPMHIGDDNILYIGAGQYLSSVNSSSTYTADAIDLPSTWRVRSITSHSNNIAIGAWKGTFRNEGRIFYWDGLDSTFFNPIELPGSCNAMINVNGKTIVQAGNKGELYYISSGQGVPIVKIPGTYTDTDKMNMNPDAIELFGPLICLGIGEFTAGNHATTEGVWTFGSKDFNYPQVINFQYPISTGDTSGVNIGSIIKIGEDLLVTWENDGSYGADFINYTSKFNNATYESTILFEGHPPKVVHQIAISCVPLPASTSITCKYKTEADTSWQTFTDPGNLGVVNTTNATELIINQQIPCKMLELQVVLGTSSNDSPKIFTIQADVRQKADR